MQSKSFHRFAVASGIIAPISVIGIILILGGLKEGYDQIEDTISELGGGDGLLPIAYRVSLSLAGLLIVYFGYYLHRMVTDGKGSRVGPYLIIAAGLGAIGSAIFLHNDIGSGFVDETNIVRNLHLFFAGITLAGSAVSPVFMYFRFKTDPIWANYAIFSVLTGVLSYIPSALLTYSLITEQLIAIEGFLEKVAVFFPMLWIFSISLKLFRSRPRYQIDKLYIATN